MVRNLTPDKVINRLTELLDEVNTINNRTISRANSVEDYASKMHEYEVGASSLADKAQDVDSEIGWVPSIDKIDIFNSVSWIAREVIDGGKADVETYSVIRNVYYTMFDLCVDKIQEDIKNAPTWEIYG